MTKFEDNVVEIFDRMIGECFTIAQQQKYGFLDSVTAQKRIEDHAFKYKASLKRKVAGMEARHKAEIESYRSEQKSE